MEQLSLFRGRELKLTDKVSIKHYTFSDIEECGYDKYCKYISPFLDVFKGAEEELDEK